MQSLVLAHDIGTTGDKATLFSADGKLLASEFSPYPTDYPESGWAEQDANDYWHAFCRATEGLLAKAKIAPGDVAVIAFSGQMMGALAVDAEGNPLRKTIIWADQRSTAEAAELAARVSPDEVYRITGHRLSASYSATKIMWIRRHEPEIYARAAKFIHAKDFLVLKLTGVFASDYSDASGTNLLDLESMSWSEELIEAAGIARGLLPDLHESIEVVGKVTPEAARQSGLLPGTPVVIGGGDGACATSGAGVVKEGDAYLCLGTSTWISTASTRPLIDPGRKTFTFALFKKGLYMPTGTMQAGGGSLKWFKDVLGEIETASAEAQSIDVYDILNREAGAAPPGSEGLLFLPYLMGERSPRWNPNARGCYIGLSMLHKRAHLIRAIMEGVAYNMKVVADTFAGLGMDFRLIRAIGGGAKSPVWMSIFADVLERPIATLNFVDEATSIGAAIAGGVGVGIFSSLEEACRIVRIERRVEPDNAHFAPYRRGFPIFERAYEQLVPIFDDLASK